jgi:hypothetical protein
MHWTKSCKDVRENGGKGRGQYMLMQKIAVKMSLCMACRKEWAPGGREIFLFTETDRDVFRKLCISDFFHLRLVGLSLMIWLILHRSSHLTMMHTQLTSTNSYCCCSFPLIVTTVLEKSPKRPSPVGDKVVKVTRHNSGSCSQTWDPQLRFLFPDMRSAEGRYRGRSVEGAARIEGRKPEQG